MTYTDGAGVTWKRAPRRPTYRELEAENAKLRALLALAWKAEIANPPAWLEKHQKATARRRNASKEES